MMAHGFTVESLGRLLLDGLATAAPGDGAGSRLIITKYRQLTFCYEAGPTGYGLHRLIGNLGHDCIVAAPSAHPEETWRSCEGVSTEDVNCRLADVQILTGIAMYLGVRPCLHCSPPQYRYVVPSSPVFDDLPDDEIPF
jgi:hypothetical protein